MKTKTAGSKRKSIGAAGIEYALLLTFVALAMAGFRLSVKTSTGAIWNNTSTGLSSMASSFWTLCRKFSELAPHSKTKGASL